MGLDFQLFIFVCTYLLFFFFNHCVIIYLIIAGITGTPETGKNKIKKASLGAEDTVPWCVIFIPSSFIIYFSNDYVVYRSYSQNTIECMHYLKKLGTKVDIPLFSSLCSAFFSSLLLSLIYLELQFLVLETGQQSTLLTTTLETLPPDLIENNPVSKIILFLFERNAQLKSKFSKKWFFFCFVFFLLLSH
jgi:hypothetical protein